MPWVDTQRRERAVPGDAFRQWRRRRRLMERTKNLINLTGKWSEFFFFFPVTLVSFSKLHPPPVVVFYPSITRGTETQAKTRFTSGEKQHAIRLSSQSTYTFREVHVFTRKDERRRRRRGNHTRLSIAIL